MPDELSLYLVDPGKSLRFMSKELGNKVCFRKNYYMWTYLISFGLARVF